MIFGDETGSTLESSDSARKVRLGIKKRHPHVGFKRRDTGDECERETDSFERGWWHFLEWRNLRTGNNGFDEQVGIQSIS